MVDPLLYMCRACHSKNMTRDFDKAIVICNDCDAKFEIIFGAWRNPGTDEAFRQEFLGKQIKDD